MKTVEFIGKDNNWQDETTNYWFNVDGIVYAVSDSNGKLQLLDCDGCPIDSCNDHDNVLDFLIPHYESHIND